MREAVAKLCTSNRSDCAKPDKRMTIGRQYIAKNARFAFDSTSKKKFTHDTMNSWTESTASWCKRLNSSTSMSMKSTMRPMPTSVRFANW